MTRGTVPTVYAVEFPELRVMKVGYSINERWLTFVARGAQIVALSEFDERHEALIFERRNHEYLRSILEPGFASQEEAAPYVGTRGAGWTECYRVPANADAKALLWALPSLETDPAIGVDNGRTLTDGRTDGRTYALQDQGSTSRVPDPSTPVDKGVSSRSKMVLS